MGFIVARCAMSMLESGAVPVIVIGGLLYGFGLVGTKARQRQADPVPNPNGGGESARPAGIGLSQ